MFSRDLDTTKSSNFPIKMGGLFHLLYVPNDEASVTEQVLFSFHLPSSVFSR